MNEKKENKAERQTNHNFKIICEKRKEELHKRLAGRAGEYIMFMDDDEGEQQ